jgi:hypothetical protein
MTPIYARLASSSVRAAVGAGIAGVAADLAGLRSLLVTVLALVFIAVAPTAAIAGLLRGFDQVARLIIACLTSIVSVTLIAMIMLSTGVWSPRAGLVAIALGTGACVLARYVSPFTVKIAERAEPLRQAMIDYCVAVGGERTAGWAATRADAVPGKAADGGDVADGGDARDQAGTDQDADAGAPSGAVAGTGPANGQYDPRDGRTEEMTIQPHVMGADAAALNPSSAPDTA